MSPIDECRIQIFLLQQLDALYVCFGKQQLALAEALHGILLEGIDTERREVLEQAYALAHAFHAVGIQLGLRRGDGVEHVLHVGVEEHGAVHDAVTGQVVEGVARNLATGHQHIVVLGGGGGQSQLSQHGSDQCHVAAEGEPYLFVASNVAHHHVALVGIDAASAALAPVELYAMLSAVVQIHLGLNVLIPAEDDAGCHLPEEETVLALVQMAGHVFFGCQIEAQPSCLLRVWELDVYHWGGFERGEWERTVWMPTCQ